LAALRTAAPNAIVPDLNAVFKTPFRMGQFDAILREFNQAEIARWITAISKASPARIPMELITACKHAVEERETGDVGAGDDVTRDDDDQQQPVVTVDDDIDAKQDDKEEDDDDYDDDDEEVPEPVGRRTSRASPARAGRNLEQRPLWEIQMAIL
jgi:hypothetical protein